MSAHGGIATGLKKDAMLTVAVSSRALFMLEVENGVFEKDGEDAFNRYMLERENLLLQPGVAFELVRKLLGLNVGGVKRVEVVMLSRNSPAAGLRVMSSVRQHGLNIERAVFCRGGHRFQYVKALGADLFLSANPESVRRSLQHGVAAATILPARAVNAPRDQLRIAFDGDAVIFGDESERVSREHGVEAFGLHEHQRAREPLSGGPFRSFLSALHEMQALFPPGEDAPVRTALVTARSAPAHERVIRTLREWGVRLDEALFLGGRAKGPFLAAFGADIFFDDSAHNIDSARQHVAAGHVPHGVANLD